MSLTRASGVNRTSARGADAAERLRVIGSFMLNEAVSNETGRVFTNTAAMMPACKTSANAPRLADHARVRGERLEKKPANRDAIFMEAPGRRTGSASIAANNFCMARTDGAPKLSFRS